MKLARDHADRQIVDKLASASSDRFDGPADVQKAVFGNQ